MDDETHAEAVREDAEAYAAHDSLYHVTGARPAPVPASLGSCQ